MRSLTGEGVRQTHDILSELLPLKRIEIPSGTQVFDWIIPKEWVVREAYIIGPDGRPVLDVKNHTLHLLNYSIPFRGTLSRQELDKHLYSLPNMPKAIPYVTSYYEPRWGFCLAEEERRQLPEGNYEVVVDTDLIDGSLTISEVILPGDEAQEVLLSTYTCHPSMANNELSGPLVSAFLYQQLASLSSRRLTYRFVFLPETIGSIAYLSLCGEHLQRHLSAGYVVTCCGDPGAYTYKRSRQGNSDADRAVEYVLKKQENPFHVVDFFPTGSDERQYCSPGFNLPVGSLMRTMYGKYPEYHTSLDNRDFISFDALSETIDLYFRACQTLEMNRTYCNQFPFCEPQLGKRGLYKTLGAAPNVELEISAISWILNMSDGSHDLLSIAERSGIDLAHLHRCADILLEHELIIES
jgi:aminopeptidase-like protein